MPTLLQDIALPTITLGEWTTSRGGQTCNLSVDNQPFIVQLNKQKEPLFAPFGLNVYGDEKTNQEAKRLNLTRDEVQIILDGGSVNVKCQEDGVWISGNIEYVFSGKISSLLFDKSE